MPPLIIGHRGASGEAAENTLAAFELAAQQKADGIEFDVFLTSDQQVVITHDENLKKFTGREMTVRKTPLEELRKYDFGQGEMIPTLEEVLEHVGQRFSVLNIEIKSTGLRTDGIEEKVISLIRKFGLQEKVFISSFNPLHLYRVRKLAPEIHRGYLFSPHQWIMRRRVPIWLFPTSTLNLEYSPFTLQRIDFYKTFRRSIWLWTVNEKKDMEVCLREPVEAIITNYPARLRKLIESHKNGGGQKLRGRPLNGTRPQ